MPINPLIHTIMVANARYQEGEFANAETAIQAISEQLGTGDEIASKAVKLYQRNNRSFSETLSAAYRMVTLNA